MAAIVVSSASGFEAGVPAGVGFVRRAANRFAVVNVDRLRVGGNRDQKNQRENKREFQSHFVSPKPADLAKRGQRSYIDRPSIANIFVAMLDPHRTPHS